MSDIPNPGSIRAARPEDASCLAVLSIEVWIGTYLRQGISSIFADYALGQFTRGHFLDLLNRSAETLLVSENREGIDGYIRVSHGNPCPGRSSSATEISTLYVQPRHQGRGLGQALLAAGIEACRSNGWNAPWLATNSENKGAIAFYLSHGFERAGQTHFQVQDRLYPNDVLRCIDF
ncbi:GCN5 family acetyltransferase [Leisingera methylohalidivorans DSM 14336]|uniref:GCN5 family acetyltransferase n=2 Tax=Leisingera methylohalidivorans TaxID=133924 RepID=V9VSS5_9RHOB|nr:N-acetyltransferase [Leisingera methylohalidivorans]AHC99921.1 GCN5 family acetyltransferase [Leisingera methylohalidivorans DSM 14336]